MRHRLQRRHKPANNPNGSGVAAERLSSVKVHVWVSRVVCTDHGVFYHRIFVFIKGPRIILSQSEVMDMVIQSVC